MGVFPVYVRIKKLSRTVGLGEIHVRMVTIIDYSNQPCYTLIYEDETGVSTH